MDTTTLREPQVEVQDRDRSQGANTGRKIVYVIGGLFLAVAILAAVGLGTWSNQLSNSLATTQEQLASLQADYGKLKADNAKVTTDLGRANSTLDQAKSDLATAKSDLAKVQADLNTANTNVATQRAQMDAAGKLTAIVEAMFLNDGNPSDVQAMIYTSGDAQLISLWDAVIQRPNDTNMLAFTRYLFGAISAALK